MLLGSFVVVIEAQKLEVCIHKENCMVEKRSEIQFTNMSDDTANIFIMNCGIRLKIYSSLRGKNSNFEFKAILLKKTVSKINVHAILKKSLHLANKINLEQKQDVSAGLLNLTFEYSTKTCKED